MIIDLISNAAVNEHGQPQTLSVLPDGIDEGDRGYGEHSDDNDYDERENVDEGGQKSHSDTTSVGRSEAALIGASLNSISEHSILFDCCNGAALVDPQYRVGSMRPALDERSIHLEMLCAEESDSEEARAKEIATAHGNFNVETFSPPTTSSGSSVGHQIPEWPGGILAAPSSANTEWSTSTVPAPPVSAAAETPRPIDYLTGEVIIWAAAGAHQSAFEASCGKSGIVTGALCKALG
ncbi:hypothetical protein FRC09_001817 [Ceratobasidium sp. 395]|nr:hypothetical protein FRC09_001817 [Ceratobasidium sp. 395]